MRDCGGAIEVNSVLDEGTDIAMFLPVFSLDSPAAQPDEAASVWSARVTGTILVVDDDQGLRGMVARGLSRLGTTTLEAPSADAAVRLIESRMDVDVVVTDLQMEGAMDGVDLADYLTASRNRAHIVLMSGDESSLRRAERRAAKDIPLLQKPFTTEQLVAALPKNLVSG